MSCVHNSKKCFLLTGFIGLVAGYGLFFLTEDNSIPGGHEIIRLENKIAELESQVLEKNQELQRMKGLNSDQSAYRVTHSENIQPKQANQELPKENLTSIASAPILDAQQILKDLSTRDDFNPRSFSERVNDLLSTNPSKDNIALASKVVVDMADNQDSLPDYELEAVYQKQTDPNLKRVTAQVLSMRGDNSLIEKQISESRAGLSSDNPEVRQKMLVELAKTHYAGAANVIAPLLNDKNTGVKLDALLALRATGNESHVHLVQGLVNHPDPSVSWLANDVINTIQNLSEKSRTKISIADIAAELPPIMVQ